MPLFPGTEANTIDGPIRTLYAPAATVAVPTRDADAIDVIGPTYAVKTGWINGGFTPEDEAEVTRDMDSEELRVDQRDAAISEKITGIVRQITIPFAEITPELMKIAEEGATIAALTATVGAAAVAKGAGKAMDFGTFESLTRFRIAIIAYRNKALAPVTEGANASTVRGASLVYFGYQCAIAAEGSSMGFQKGTLTNRSITFTLFPETTITDPAKQHGRYFFEDFPQTIAAA